MMARMKETPKNPHVHRPQLAVGSNVQQTEGKVPLKSVIRKVPVKGGKQPRKHHLKKLLQLGAPPNGGIKKPHCY